MVTKFRLPLMIAFEHMFPNDHPGDRIYTARCGVCRRNSWRSADPRNQGKAPFLGRLHVYDDDRISSLSERPFPGGGRLVEDDGFYATFETFKKATGHNHEQRLASQGPNQDPPKRTRPTEFMAPGREVRFQGHPIGAKFKAKCQRGHSIQVTREQLRHLVNRAGDSETIFIG